MPAFTVIAGPNGAGKSAFSSVLSPPGTVIFDPDKIKGELSLKYPDISEEAIETELTRVYERLETQIIQERLSFTIESNLRSAFLIDRAKTFKKRRYEVNLIYMMLPSITYSMDRVNLRVKRKGHFVDAESIKVNFQQCQLQVEAFIPVVHNLMLLDASSSDSLVSPPKVLAIYRNRYFSGDRLLADVPIWVAEQVGYLTTKLTIVDESFSIWNDRLPGTKPPLHKSS